MEQTPAHENHNAELLRMIPVSSRRLVEAGCSSGALAREYKRINPACHYTGIEIDPAYARLAMRHCDRVIECDVEADWESLGESQNADCWVFGDCLEHLRDPWNVLARIRSLIPADGAVVACIPNAQHWSLQARMCVGEFRYERAGLLDRTHLRWFTRITMLEMFAHSGFKVVAGLPRVFNDPARDRVLALIRTMAAGLGADPDQAASDAMATQYVVRAVPI